jgi:hypothetical protein
MGNSNRALWKLPEMSLEADGANMGSIRARFNVSGSSGSPTTITAHFGCDGSTMSGAEMDLVSTGYRTSLVKRRFVAGELTFSSCFFCFLKSLIHSRSYLNSFPIFLKVNICAKLRLQLCRTIVTRHRRARLPPNAEINS